MLSFDEKEQELLSKVTSLYKKTKPLILFSEEIDPNYEGNAQVWKELRDALDHLMRVFARKFEGCSLSEEDQRYIDSNLQKVIGHIYRAGCDALEGACLSLREEIKKGYEAFSLEALNAVIPSFWKNRARLHEISERIAKLRAQKDVADDEMEQIFEDFVEIVNELKEIYDQFKTRIPALYEYQEKKDHEDRKIERKRWKRDLIMLLLGAAFSALLSYLISSF